MIGVISNLLYSRAMVTVSQGTLKKIRDDMFEKMQRLPIRVFDTRTHGDIMSLYTNDTDTLRQMIAQSMAQLISSVFTIVAVLVCMLYTSIWLTIVAVWVMLLILQIVKGIAENGYTVSGAQTVTNEADSATITAVYEATGSKSSGGSGRTKRSKGYQSILSRGNNKRGT